MENIEFCPKAPALIALAAPTPMSISYVND
jgi:hypothetical protein